MEAHRNLWLWLAAALVAAICALVGVAGGLAIARAHFNFWGSTELIVVYAMAFLVLVFFACGLRGVSFPLAVDQRVSAEREVAESLVNWLTYRRVLWNPMIKEFPHETIDSAVKIRDRIDVDRRSMRDTSARRELEVITTACLVLLDAPRERLPGSSWNFGGDPRGLTVRR